MKRILALALLITFIATPAMADPHRRDGTAKDCFILHRVTAITISQDYFWDGRVINKTTRTSTDNCLSGGYTWKWWDYR